MGRYLIVLGTSIDTIHEMFLLDNLGKKEKSKIDQFYDKCATPHSKAVFAISQAKTVIHSVPTPQSIVQEQITLSLAKIAELLANQLPHSALTALLNQSDLITQ